MKISGKLWNEYLASWPEDWWLDESDESVDGKLLDDMPEDYEVRDTDVLTVKWGYITQSAEQTVSGVSLIPHLIKWLKSKNATTILCSVPNEFLDTFTAFAKANNIGLSK